jgi:hypothetical protein
MPVLLTQSIECTQHFNASLPCEVSADKAKSDNANFRPSSVIGLGNEGFLWGMKNLDGCLGSVQGQLKVFGTFRDCNKAKTLGTLKGTPFQENKKKSSFRNPRECGFEENEKWSTIDANGVEAQEYSLIEWSEKETLPCRPITHFR